MKRQKDKFSWDLHWENEYTSQRGLLGDVNSLKAEDDQLQLSPNNTISIHYRKKRLWKFLKLSPKGKCFHIRSTNSLRKYIEMSLEIGTNLRFMKKTDKFSLEGKFCSLYQNSSSNGLTFQNNEVPRTILTHCKHLSVYFKRKVITLEIFFFFFFCSFQAFIGASVRICCAVGLLSITTTCSFTISHNETSAWAPKWSRISWQVW